MRDIDLIADGVGSVITRTLSIMQTLLFEWRVFVLENTNVFMLENANSPS